MPNDQRDTPRLWGCTSLVIAIIEGMNRALEIIIEISQLFREMKA